MTFILWLAVLGAVLLTLALTSSYVRWMPVTTSAVCLLLGIAIGAFLATLNVFFRDIGQLSDVVFQALFWATPIVYPLSILSERVQGVLSWSPIFSLVLTAQKALLGEAADLSQLVYPLVFAVIVFLLAVVLYKRSYNDLLDQI